MAVNPKKLRPYDQPPKRRRALIPGTPDAAATAFLVLSVLWLVVATGIGALWGAELVFPQMLTARFEQEIPIYGTLAFELSPATVQSGFLNAFVFGWLSNAAFAAILFVTPRVTGTRVVGEKLATMSAGIWNLGVASGLAAVYFPNVAQKGPLAEFPFPADGLLLLAMLIVNLVFWRTLLKAPAGLPYVSVWYFGIGLLAVMGAYFLAAAAPVAEVLIDLPEAVVPLVTAFAARVIEGYWLLGAALGALYYVVPRATGNPLFSSGLAMLGWALWAGLAGVAALGALVDTSVPFVITSIGRVGTMLMVAPVFLAAANLLLTISGRWSLMLATGTVPFAVVSITFLLGSALLYAIGSLVSVFGVVRDTDWPMGAWIFAAVGAYTFALFAAADHAAPRLLRRDWRGTILADAQLWTTFAGAAVASLALMAAGIVHGSLRLESASGEEINATLLLFRMMAASGLGLAALGGIAAATALFLMYTTAPRAEYVIPTGATATAGQ